MVSNLKLKVKTSSMPIGVGLGAVVCILMTMLGAAVTAWAVSSERLTQEYIGYCVMGILFLGSFLGTVTAVGKIKYNRAFVCAAVGIAYYIILLAFTALFFGGQYEGFGATGLMILLGCGCALLLGLKPKKEKGRRKIKIRPL